MHQLAIDVASTRYQPGTNLVLSWCIGINSVSTWDHVDAQVSTWFSHLRIKLMPQHQLGINLVSCSCLGINLISS